ncbi:MAG: Stf0 family sulfotransferase [Rhizomicrobium sp.]
MHVIGRLYSDEFDFPLRTEAPDISYTIATLPRSGSTHLSIELWRSGVLGSPLEYINVGNIGAITGRLGGGDILRYWSEVQARRTGPNGVFGYKSFAMNFLNISRRFPQLLPHLAPAHVIYLVRGDKLAQAVSYARAMQTRIWFAGVEPERAPEYSFEAISRCLGMIDNQEATWERIFNLTNACPLRLEYGEVRKDPAGTIERVAAHIGVAVSADARLDIPGTDVQSDAINREWLARYRKEAHAQSAAAASI